MRKILIVEDELPILDILSEKFAERGFEVKRAGNGEEGLRLALAEHPDLILLDIVMPRMDGMTMFRKLRQDPWGKDASVIVLTNLSDGRMLDEFQKKGAYDYLIKTEWGLGELIEKIQAKFGE